LLVLKIALGIILAFVVIGAAQCLFAVALLRGITAAIPTPTVRGVGIGLTTPARTSARPSTSLSRASGSARVTVLVLDESTLQPVSGVCVTVGPSSCDIGTVRTDASGHLTLDVPIGSTVYFSHPNYVARQQQPTIAAGQTTTWQMSMHRSP
jgi:hypothetical protein